MSADADGILDFTVPAATIANVAIAAERGLVHVIGTTGLSSSDEAVIKSVTSRAIVVKSGNMSLGVNLLAALVKRVAQSLDESFDIEMLEMHHRAKIDAPSGTALMLGEAAAAGRDIALDAAFGAGPRRHHRRAQDRRYRLCVVARRHRHRRPQRDFRRSHGAHRADAPRRGPHHVRAGRDQGGALGARQEARILFDDRRAGACGLLKSANGNKKMSDRLLVLVRHGQSEWNLKNLFTGWKDPDLTEIGHRGSQGSRAQAEGAGF